MQLVSKFSQFQFPFPKIKAAWWCWSRLKWKSGLPTLTHSHTLISDIITTILLTQSIELPNSKKWLVSDYLWVRQLAQPSVRNSPCLDWLSLYVYHHHWLWGELPISLNHTLALPYHHGLPPPPPTMRLTLAALHHHHHDEEKTGWVVPFLLLPTTNSSIHFNIMTHRWME